MLSIEIKNNLNGNKASVWDKITGEILEQLPKKGIVYLTAIYDATFRLVYFPTDWKTRVKIIIVQKPARNI